MFDESIKRLAKVLKYVEKANLEHLQDNMFLSTLADNVSLSLSIAISDLSKINKALRKVKENEKKL